MSNLDDSLAWLEPDSGCVGCGKPYITVANHRCSDCLGESLHYCPHCLDEIGAIIDQEVVRRLRETSADVNTVWTQHRYYQRYRDQQRALDARAAQDGAP